MNPLSSEVPLSEDGFRSSYANGPGFGPAGDDASLERYIAKINNRTPDDPRSMNDLLIRSSSIQDITDCLPSKRTTRRTCHSIVAWPLWRRPSHRMRCELSCEAGVAVSLLNGG